MVRRLQPSKSSRKSIITPPAASKRCVRSRDFPKRPILSACWRPRWASISRRSCDGGPEPKGGIAAHECKAALYAAARLRCSEECGEKIGESSPIALRAICTGFPLECCLNQYLPTPHFRQAAAGQSQST